MITNGSGNLLVPELYGSIYDSLGSNLLSGRTIVHAVDAGIENTKRGLEAQVYFGPFPALLRMPLNLLFPDHFGLWSRSSCFLAGILCALFFAKTCWLMLRRASYNSKRIRLAIFYPSILAFTLGTPLFYLMTVARVYNEAMLWGLTGSLIFLFGALRLLIEEHKSRRAQLYASVGAGIALLSRVSFGVSVLLVTVLITVVSFRKDRKQFNILCTLPLVAALLFQGWYNLERVGHPALFARWSIPVASESGKEGLKRKGWNKQFFHPERFPVGIKNYFGTVTEHFSNKPPYVHTLRSHHLDSYWYALHWREHVISLPVVSSWILIFGLAGLLLATREKEGRIMLLCGLPLVLQWVLIFGFHAIRHRYTAELLPLLSFLFAMWILYCPKVLSLKSQRVVTVGGFSTLVLLSISATVLSTISWCIVMAGRWGVTKEFGLLLGKNLRFITF